MQPKNINDCRYSNYRALDFGLDESFAPAPDGTIDLEWTTVDVLLEEELETTLFFGFETTLPGYPAPVSNAPRMASQSKDFFSTSTLSIEELIEESLMEMESTAPTAPGVGPDWLLAPAELR